MNKKIILTAFLFVFCLQATSLVKAADIINFSNSKLPVVTSEDYALRFNLGQAPVSFSGYAYFDLHTLTNVSGNCENSSGTKWIFVDLRQYSDPDYQHLAGTWRIKSVPDTGDNADSLVGQTAEPVNIVAGDYEHLIMGCEDGKSIHHISLAASGGNFVSSAVNGDDGDIYTGNPDFCLATDMNGCTAKQGFLSGLFGGGKTESATQTQNQSQSQPRSSPWEFVALVFGLIVIVLMTLLFVNYKNDVKRLKIMVIVFGVIIVGLVILFAVVMF